MTIRLAMVDFYGWSIVTVRPSGTVVEIWRLKHNGFTTLTFGVT